MIITTAIQKGGTGKTTTATNVCAELVARGAKVLAIDLDPQGNMTKHLGINRHEQELSTYHLLCGGATLKEVIVKTECGVDLAPSNVGLARVETDLLGALGREKRLGEALEGHGYDYVVIDTPPSLGMATTNALAASDEVLIPLVAEPFAMDGVADFMTTVEVIQRYYNAKLGILGILITKADPERRETVLFRQAVEKITGVFGDLLFKTRIPRRNQFPEASGHGVPMTLYPSGEFGAKAYGQLVTELLQKLKGDGR